MGIQKVLALTLRREIAQMDKLVRNSNLKFPRISPYKASMRLNTPQKQEMFSQYVQRIGDVVDKQRQEVCSFDVLDIIKSDIKGLKKNHYGDCGESSSLTMGALLANGYKDGKIMQLMFDAEVRDMTTHELLDKRVLDTTHQFVVRHYNEAADFSNPKTYGKNLIVMDAWGGFCANMQEAFKKYYELFMNGMRKYQQPEHNIEIIYKPRFAATNAERLITPEDIENIRKLFPELIV
ncbi:MAG: hypothetical protein MJ231_08375 [bacterium]|nr:hypothetical protein [bacterium]